MRLATAADCPSCHTEDEAKPFADGYGWGAGSGAAVPLSRYRSVNDPKGLNAMAAAINGIDLHTGHSRIHMPAFGRSYSDAELAAAVRYLTAAFGNKRSKAGPRDIAVYRKAG